MQSAIKRARKSLFGRAPSEMGMAPAGLPRKGLCTVRLQGRWQFLPVAGGAAARPRGGAIPRPTRPPRPQQDGADAATGPHAHPRIAQLGPVARRQGGAGRRVDHQAAVQNLHGQRRVPAHLRRRFCAGLLRSRAGCLPG
jgi:hypothetical protein